jgi:hypothetical protein
VWWLTCGAHASSCQPRLFLRGDQSVADCLNEGGCVVADMWSARFLMSATFLRGDQSVADCLNEGGCVVADMWSARFLMESQQLKTGQVMEYQRDRERRKWGRDRE